jgi:hypothetical protein
MRAKQVCVTFAFMNALLQGDGKYKAIRFNGLPEGAEVISIQVDPNAYWVLLTFYHPDFPELEEGAPFERIHCRAEEVVIYTCKDCGTHNDVTYTTCPYEADVNERATHVWLCDKCEKKRGSDI